MQCELFPVRDEQFKPPKQVHFHRSMESRVVRLVGNNISSSQDLLVGSGTHET